MSSRPPKVTVLTADYDAIEKAIRETSRGRWFLAAYLERNRSAETRMLLNAIGKLESAMRESGRTVENFDALDTLASLREEIMAARHDLAHMKRRKGAPTWLPVPRFTFDSIPAIIAEETRAIKAAAASLDTAASALKSAGLFQGVAEQIAQRAVDIRDACEAQDLALDSVMRMTDLLAELEAEIMGTFDGSAMETGECSAVAEVRPISARADAKADWASIPPEVVQEISLALAAETADANERAHIDEL